MPHYFDSSPAVPSRPSTVDAVVDGRTFTLTTDRGVFAAGAVDAGTRVLVDALRPPPSGDLLDLGCGYGLVALALAARAPAALVWAVDVNERALALTAANAAAAGLANVRAVTPEAVPPGLRFAGLWSNPPIRIGKEALHALLATWLDRLAPGATAGLVVHKNLGADSLARWLSGQGWPTTKESSKQGYRILRASARAGP